MSHHQRFDPDLEGVVLGKKSWMNNLPPPPSPLPPTLPPPKEKESEPVYKFVVKDEDECLKALEEEARRSRYGRYISHLKYSEFDWTIPVKDFQAGKCIVKGMDCQLTPIMAKALRGHFLPKRHRDWDEKMQKKAEEEAKGTKRKLGEAFPASDNGE
ncbi:unnamed protein product [Clonostachys byssicola]|uniref:Uncharacterized protein n=1 Tax=Clonostachys byssicola TaxID=160290 RepID=A0A9N9U5D9_9HYPO|nr:unnamed protein product [Clonostachys byssicola]